MTISQNWRFIPALLWMALIFFLSSRETLPSPPGLSYDFGAIIGHFIVYAILTIAYLFAFERRIENDLTTIVAAIFCAALFSISDEIHQSFVPGRMATIFDVVIDLIGAVSGAWFWRVAGRGLVRKFGLL